MLDFVTSEWVWLPGEVRWSEVQRGAIWYLHAVPWLALLLLLLRTLSRWSAGVVGSALGVSGKTCRRPPSNAVLEAAFSRSRRPSSREEEVLAEKVGWPPHRVRRWLHKARNWQKPSTLAKFQENSWRLILYSVSTTYGLTVLFNEPYFLDLSQCYSGYPSKAPSHLVMGYWCLQVALYTSELVTCLTGAIPRKKDFLALMLHHCVTVALLVICYTVNMVPIGLVVAVLHDVADVFLEMAKLLVYIGRPAMANAMFAIFSLAFITTRLVILPNWVLPSLMYDLPRSTGHHSYITSTAIVFIMGLLGLHIYWLGLIAKVAVQLLTRPGCGDSRSESELSDSDASNTHTPHHHNQ